MRRWIGIYIFVVLAQYALNPFVPGPRPLSSPRISRVTFHIPQNPDRRPAGLGAPLFLDENGLIVQANGDGGDTAQRTGMFYFIQSDPVATADEFANALDQLEVQPGIYVRHPHQSDFRNDPRRFSRDQQTPIVIALGKYKMYGRLFRLLKAQVIRFGKYQNLDYIGPTQIGEYVRAFDCVPLYPLLLVTDFGLLWSSAELVTTRVNPDEVDDNNHVMSLLQAKEVMPTPMSWLARKIYKAKRPLNYGVTVLGEKDAVQGAISWYHRFESGGSPAIAESYRPAIADL